MDATRHGRTTHASMYSSAGVTPDVRGLTWLESESFAYPSGSISAGRKARVFVRANPHNPIADLPIGSLRVVKVGIPDTFSSIPARMTFKGKSLPGYVSVDTDRDVFLFTPEANPAACVSCAVGDGCKA